MRKGSLGVTFFPSVCMYVRRFWEIHFFLVNYNCDALYDHLWCPNGPEVDWKWPEVGQKWTGSVHLSVPTSVHPKTLPLPPWRTLCERSTSAGRLRPAIFRKKVVFGWITSWAKSHTFDTWWDEIQNSLGFQFIFIRLTTELTSSLTKGERDSPGGNHLNSNNFSLNECLILFCNIVSQKIGKTLEIRYGPIRTHMHSGLESISLKLSRPLYQLIWCLHKNQPLAFFLFFPKF